MKHLSALLLLSAFVLPAGALDFPGERLNSAGFREVAEAAPAVGLAPATPQPVEAQAAECYLLYRLVEWKDASKPDSEFKPYNDHKSRISKRLLPHIVGIMTPWAHKVRGEDLWLTKLRLEGGGLKALVALEKNDFPMDEEWDVIWEREIFFPLDQEVFFASRILDKDFRIRILLSLEKSPELCRLPAIPPRRQ